MIPESIALKRLYQQRLVGDLFTTPEEVVSWLGAVQAQEYYGAIWSLGLRMEGATDALIEDAFTAGRILRTHIMRPTWHFVTPEDIRWIMTLTAPRAHAMNATMYRNLGLDDALLARSQAVITQALMGGHFLTREEIGIKLAEAGIKADGQRLGYIVHHAELELVVCSGARRGKKFTYALVDERAPNGEILDRDEALAKLTLRYFTGHAPATVKDFSWWSGLTLTDAKLGVDMVASELQSEEIDGEIYWSAQSALSSMELAPTAFLIPRFDEYFIGYTSYGKAVSVGQVMPKNMIAEMPIVYGGRIIGTWKRTLTKKEVKLELAPFKSLSPDEREAVMQAVERYGEFLGLSVTCTFV